MNPTAYLKTTIIGYLAMKPSGVLRIASNQQTTHEWWTGHRHRFSVYVSRFVVGECAAGYSVAAADRLRVLAEVPLLEVTADAESLAAALLEEVPLPPKGSHRRPSYRGRGRQRCRISPDLELQAYRSPCPQAANGIDVS